MKALIILTALFVSAGCAIGADFTYHSASDDSQLFHDNEWEVSVQADFATGGASRRTVEKTEKRTIDKPTVNSRAIVSPTTAVTFEPVRETAEPETETITSKHTFEDAESTLFGGRSAYGGGVSVNGFFKRYFGFGLQLDGLASNRAVSLAQGKLLVRYPMVVTFLGNQRGIAPYAFVSGGGAFGNGAKALMQVGVGLELRVSPEVFFFLQAGYAFDGDEDGELISLGMGMDF